jgi:5-methylcytosine-specific restriction endonuclease McrA
VPKPITHSHSKWRALAAKVLARAKANGEPCWICREPIDWDAPKRSPKSPTVDHLDPVSLGNPVLADLHRLAVACKSCNSRRGDGTRPLKPKPRGKPMRHSESW